MSDFSTFENSLKFAENLDQNDPLREYRERFFLPKDKQGNELIYFCGNSLGLQPKGVRESVLQELTDWENLGVEGHFHAKNPWMPYHRYLTDAMATIVGGKAIEVVTMNSLTVNLHLLMASFYRPLPHRYKILIEANAFPSDQYATQSQIHFHQVEMADALTILPLRTGEITHRTDDIVKFIETRGEEFALILMGGVNYYTGQAFDIQRITATAHEQGCIIGWDLAHAAGNLHLKLHDWNVDFAAWCSYKYLNSGPGGLSGIFVHERHAERFDLPRFAGWWGHDEQTRFQMKPTFKPMRGAEGWQLSNPPILAMAALKASLAVFQEVGMEKLRKKSELMTAYLSNLLYEIDAEKLSILTPKNPSERGCQLSLVVSKNGKDVFNKITEKGVICDWREPDVIRIAAVPLYNSFTELYKFYTILKAAIG